MYGANGTYRATTEEAHDAAHAYALCRVTDRRGIGLSGIGNESAADVFALVVAYKLEHDGNAPSVRQLTEQAGFSSTAGAQWALDILFAAGLLERGGKRARYLKVPGGSWRYEGPEPAGVSDDALDAFDAICEYKSEHDGNAPTAVDVAELCEFSSVSYAHAAMTELLETGLLSRPESHSARRLEVVGGRWSWNP